MNWFKRLCLFVFSLSGLASLAALSLTYAGPWQIQARTLVLEVRWYYYVLCALVCISVVGLLLTLLRSLFAPRNPRETIVAEVEGGDIIVTRTAIVSQARHVVEGEGNYVASSIHVRVRKRGHVRVSMRVTPRRPVDVVASGEELYAKLASGLAEVCGDSVTSINLVFTDPEQFDDGPSVGVEATKTTAQKPANQRRVVKSESSVSLPSERFGLAQQEEEQPSSELTVAVVSNLPKRDDDAGIQEPSEASVIPSKAPKDTSAEEA